MVNISTSGRLLFDADGHFLGCQGWLAADKPDLDSLREALTAIAKDSDRAGAVIARDTRPAGPLTGRPQAVRPTGVIREALPS